MEISFGSTGATGLATLYHGSALVYCGSIATSGLDETKLKEACPGAYAFCTTTEFKTAQIHAMLNPLVHVQKQAAGVLKFDLPSEIMQYLLGEKIAFWRLEDQAYEILPGAFPTVNSQMTGIVVRAVTDTTIKFDE
jgi:hypothetical protein